MYWHIFLSSGMHLPCLYVLYLLRVNNVAVGIHFPRLWIPCGLILMTFVFYCLYIYTCLFVLYYDRAVFLQLFSFSLCSLWSIIPIIIGTITPVQNVAQHVCNLRTRAPPSPARPRVPNPVLSEAVALTMTAHDADGVYCQISVLINGMRCRLLLINLSSANCLRLLADILSVTASSVTE